MNIFTVTQMELLKNIPPELKGKGANIAIIDSTDYIPPNGFHDGHQTFSCRWNKEFEAVLVTNKTITVFDKTFHATICAGIAVGEPFKGYYFTMDGKRESINYKGGVAPEANAKIFLIDTHDDLAFLGALESIERETKYDVISISLGYPECDTPKDIRKQLIKLSASTLIVVSAGNYGSVKGVIPPANLKEVISVGSLEKFGNRDKSSPTLVDISCYGEVCAPATDISGISDDIDISDIPNGLVQWAAGTSMAAPAIAGLICLIMQIAKNEEKYLSPDDREYVLRQIKEKRNMLRLLKKTVTLDNQVKPAVLLNEAFVANNFKEWFDTKMKE